MRDEATAESLTRQDGFFSARASKGEGPFEISQKLTFLSLTSATRPDSFPESNSFDRGLK